MGQSTLSNQYVVIVRTMGRRHWLSAVEGQVSHGTMRAQHLSAPVCSLLTWRGAMSADLPSGGQVVSSAAETGDQSYEHGQCSARMSSSPSAVVSPRMQTSTKHPNIVQNRVESTNL